jgi:hypothetical protein
MCPRMILKALQRQSLKQVRARNNKVAPPDTEWVATGLAFETWVSSRKLVSPEHPSKTSPRQSIHTEISPLRFASVEMTKGRVALYSALVTGKEDRPLMGLRPVFIGPRTLVRTWARSELCE